MGGTIRWQPYRPSHLSLVIRGLDRRLTTQTAAGGAGLRGCVVKLYEMSGGPRTREQALALLDGMQVDRHGYIVRNSFIPVGHRDTRLHNLSCVGVVMVDPNAVKFDHDAFSKARMRRMIAQGPPSQRLRSTTPDEEERLFRFLDDGEGDEQELTRQTGVEPSDDELPLVLEIPGGYQVGGNGNHRVLWAKLYNEPIKCRLYRVKT